MHKEKETIAHCEHCEKETHDMHCNMCGKPLDFFDMQGDFTIHKRIGYGSCYDNEELNIHICCGCMDWIIENCRISPITNT